jgi:hypothetical protein
VSPIGVLHVDQTGSDPCVRGLTTKVRRLAQHRIGAGYLCGRVDGEYPERVIPNLGIRRARVGEKSQQN